MNKASIKKLKKRIEQRKDVAERMHLLTRRQLSVLRMTGSGYKESQIASKLNISKKTVDAHKSGAVKNLKLRGGRAEYRKVAFRYAVGELLGE